MTKKKLSYQQIRHACISFLLLTSLMSFSQSMQAQPLLSQNTTENNQKKPNKPKSPDNSTSNGRPRGGAEDKPEIENNQHKLKKRKWHNNGVPTGRRRGGAGRNPDCPSSLTRLSALVPGDGKKSFLASTVAAYPTFWFYVPELPETALRAEFVLQAQSGKQVHNVYRKPFPLSGKAGIISMSPPAKQQYSLKVNKTYHWYFHIYCGDTKAASDNFYVDGFIQKEALTKALDSQLKIAKPREYIAYSANNIWYDALTNLGQLRRANPQNVIINKDWMDLLSTVGLAELASEPIVEHYNLEK